MRTTTKRSAINTKSNAARQSAKATLAQFLENFFRTGGIDAGMGQSEARSAALSTTDAIFERFQLKAR